MSSLKTSTFSTQSVNLKYISSELNCKLLVTEKTKEVSQLLIPDLKIRKTNKGKKGYVYLIQLPQRFNKLLRAGLYDITIVLNNGSEIPVGTKRVWIMNDRLWLTLPRALAKTWEQEKIVDLVIRQV